MIAIISLLVTFTLSVLVTRVGAMALMLTGMSREAARFQARSAFAGVGFTTSEAESITDHPVRRKIVMVLMLLGNVGVATVVATLIVSLIDLRDRDDWYYGIGLMFGGLVVLWMLASSRWVERRLNKVIAWSLKRFSRLDVRDYVAVLHLQQGYAITETRVREGDWLTGRKLVDINLPREGVLILGIQRVEPGEYIGAPTGQTEIRADDVLVLYGPIDRLDELDRRRAGRRGDKAHKQAVSEHREVLEDQEKMEAADESRDPAEEVSG